MSASRATRSLLLRKNGVKKLVICDKNSWVLGNIVQVQGLSSIACINKFSSAVGAKKRHLCVSECNYGVLQKRGLLGCGDGAEANVLAKVYEEKRVLGYSPEQLYSVVAAVDLYSDFVPWCQKSDIVRSSPDGSFDAELEIGFKFLVERYMSHVELNKPKYVKTTVSESGLFDHLINIWEFNKGPLPGTCSLYFMVDFKFQSPFYRHMATVFFKEVVSRLVGSFNDRCCTIYGPGVPVHEYTDEGQRRIKSDSS